MKAYWDTFSGLVPCRLLRVDLNAHGSKHANIVLTAARGPYKRGENIWVPAGCVVPRNAVRFRKYGTRILAHTPFAARDYT